MGGLCSADQDRVKSANLQAYNEPQPVPADAPSAAGPEEYKLENIRKRLGIPPPTSPGATQAKSPAAAPAEDEVSDPLIRDFEEALAAGEVPTTQQQCTQAAPSSLRGALTSTAADKASTPSTQQLTKPSIPVAEHTAAQLYEAHTHPASSSCKSSAKQLQDDDPLYRSFEESHAEHCCGCDNETQALNDTFMSAESSPDPEKTIDNSPLRKSATDVTTQVKQNDERRKARLGREKQQLSQTFPLKPTRQHKAQRRKNVRSPPTSPSAGSNIDTDALSKRAEAAGMFAPTPPASPDTSSEAPTTPNGKHFKSCA